MNHKVQRVIHRDEDSDYSEEDMHNDNHLPHKLKEHQAMEMLNQTIGTNSALDQDMSALGGTTFHMGKTFASRINAMAQSPYPAGITLSQLPSIVFKDAQDPRYQTRAQRLQSQKPGQTSKTTLNVMNVTFNSRPGVKQYIHDVVGSGGIKAVAVNQLPKQGLRQNKHNGYNNFYFSSKKRGTVQRFNLLDDSMKTKVQENLLREDEIKIKLLSKQSKKKLLKMELQI